MDKKLTAENRTGRVLLIEDDTLAQASFFGNWYLYQTDLYTPEAQKTFAMAMFDSRNEGLTGWDMVEKNGWKVSVLDACDLHDTEHRLDYEEAIAEKNGWYDKEGKLTHPVGVKELLEYLNLDYDECFCSSDLKEECQAETNMTVQLIHSSVRGTWNIVVNEYGWYFEGTYDECKAAFEKMPKTVEELPNMPDWEYAEDY